MIDPAQIVPAREPTPDDQIDPAKIVLVTGGNSIVLAREIAEPFTAAQERRVVEIVAAAIAAALAGQQRKGGL